MMTNRMSDLEEVAQAAQAVDGIESAAVFVAQPGSSDLDLAGAAGIAGPPLDGLVEAVRNPAHPIARAMQDTRPTFDVRPMNPGGPALRSHLPLGGRGVLAVAHERSLSTAGRSALEELAASAAAILRRAAEGG
jgi:hypothetical protein